MKVKINIENKPLDITKLIESFKKGGKKDWIKGAVNPAHKGYCTPVSKASCTPRRKAFAMTMKKHHGFHKAQGGGLETTFDQYKKGGKPKDTTPKQIKKRINIPFKQSGGKIDFDISKILKLWKQ